ncbi:hypothetical protein CYMTET_33280, partial [Cymbomonas tetramitiformis]
VAVSIQLWASTLSSARGAQVAVSIQLWASTLSSARGTPSYNLSKPITGGGDSLLFYRIQFFVCPHKLVRAGAARVCSAAAGVFLAASQRSVDMLKWALARSTESTVLGSGASRKSEAPPQVFPGAADTRAATISALNQGAAEVDVLAHEKRQSSSSNKKHSSKRSKRPPRPPPAPPVVYSPAVSYLSYWGGADSEEARAAKLTTAGELVVAGTSLSSKPSDGTHSFVALLGKDGSTRWKTKLSGNGNDFVTALALQFSQEKSTGVWVVGHSTSTHFPGVSKSDQSHRDVGRGAARLDADVLTALLDIDTGVIVKLQTLGGSGHDRGLGAAVAPGGGVWISGDAQSVDLPTTSDAMRLTRGSGGSDAMLARMSSKGTTEPCCQRSVAVVPLLGALSLSLSLSARCTSSRSTPALEGGFTRAWGHL